MKWEIFLSEVSSGFSFINIPWLRQWTAFHTKPNPKLAKVNRKLLINFSRLLNQAPSAKLLPESNKKFLEHKRKIHTF